MSRYARLKVLIVDDEPLARIRLRRLLSDAGVVRIDEAESGENAVAVCLEQAPDVVFLDIEMPGMNGLEVAGRIRRSHPQTRVVFCTAYDAFALKAFDLDACDYLLKPLSRERLQQALEKLPLSVSDAAITVRIGNDLVRIPVGDIYYCHADHKCVTCHHKSGEVILDESLNQLQQRFPEQFVRIHRSYLVSRKRLIGLKQDRAGRFMVCLRGVECALPVSRRNLSTVRKILKDAL